MTRKEANEQLVKEIAKWVERFPDWRFHQILNNIGVEKPNVDQWYEESDTTLKNVQAETSRWGFSMTTNKETYGKAESGAKRREQVHDIAS